MKNKERLHALMFAAGIAALCGCSPKGGVNPQTPSVTATNVKLSAEQLQNVHLFKVEVSTFHRTVETTGIVDFDNDQATSVLAPFSGPVSRLLVSLGDRVKQGAALAVVDSPDFAAAIGAYRKAIATAQTSRRLADLDKELIEHNGVAKREADQAETDALNAEADREAALQALVSLQVPAQTIKEIQEGHTNVRVDGVIRAPVAGTVVEKLITPGQLLQPGTTPCFTVADLSRVWVMAQVFGSDLESVKVGDSAEVVTGAGSTVFPGVVDNISALVDPDTRSVVVRVVVKNPGELLKKQMYVRVVLHARQQTNGILVPVSAVLRDDVNLPFVYTEQSDGSFIRQHVTLGYRFEDRYEITEGLNAGDSIVVDGGIFVQFMQSQ
ncbi:MAG TPA: efflux RND transporter periplasmic adaptor subunit [Steroidobacteraceae bacterium]|jgi:cobalt-zinc-cadmium efflux system membrane fusion protein|nr:efflux RND transporter periplasmic adaptor subunit [Steroidobacteraceae bacterium]